MCQEQARGVTAGSEAQLSHVFFSRCWLLVGPENKGEYVYFMEVQDGEQIITHSFLVLESNL